jgi:lipopolysaccharide export system permease protein
MRIPITLSKYIGIRFLFSIGIVLATFVFITILFDIIEISRRAQDHHVPLRIILGMVFLKLPHIILDILPFIILLGSILTFSSLTRNSELVVARASGVSAWQFLLPAISISFVIGVLVVGIINPLSAILLSRFEALETKYLDSSAGSLSVSSTGLWLKQQNKDDGSKIIIHALHASNETATLFDATFFIFSKDNIFLTRIATKEAVLSPGYWTIKNGTLIDPNKQSLPEPITNYRIPTTLRLNQIQDSFSSPETVIFWRLPEFIKTLKAAGLSTVRHTLYWHKVMVVPFLLSAMVFFAAAFSLRLPRKGKTGLLVSGGILAGFLIRFLSDLVSAMGLAGTIPLVFAAWAPVLISILLGAGLMLHLEDG